MKRLLVIGCLAVALAACGEGEKGQTSEPGNPAVYQRIAKLDCSGLQREFETAMANVERFPAGSEEREIPFAYAEAAQARIEELAC